MLKKLQQIFDWMELAINMLFFYECEENLELMWYKNLSNVNESQWQKVTYLISL